MASQPGHTHAVTVTRLVNATPERVFEAWTTPALMKQWNTAGDQPNSLVEVDLRVGGRYRIDMISPRGNTITVSGEYREIDPPRRLVYTWFWDTNPVLGVMLVTVDFHRRGEQTEIVLVHSDALSDEAIAAHRSGWLSAFAKLEAVLASS